MFIIISEMFPDRIDVCAQSVQKIMKLTTLTVADDRPKRIAADCRSRRRVRRL